MHNRRLKVEIICNGMMIVLARLTRENRKTNGFTLIELIMVLSVMGIVAAILVPSMVKLVEKAEKRVCSLNKVQLQRMYEGYLELEGIEHSEEILSECIEEYKRGLCPGKGQITYKDEKIRCSVHLEVEQGESEGDVPYL